MMHIGRRMRKPPCKVRLEQHVAQPTGMYRRRRLPPPAAGAITQEVIDVPAVLNAYEHR
jgi:hypothetical protein